MALFNKSKREINAKIVYFGAPFSGKSSSLGYIHRKLKPEHRGSLKTMGGQRDRMIFFDFMPPELGEVNGCRVRFHLYTVQGEVSDPSSWKTVLKGADGVVFVADSSPAALPAGRESMERLLSYLQGYGQPLEELSCVVQCTKSDLPGALSADEVLRGIGAVGLPAVPAVATAGEGVLQSLGAVVKGILGKLRERREEERFPSVPPVNEREETAVAAEEPGAETPPPAEAEPVAPAPSAKRAEPVPEPFLEIAGLPEVTADGRCRLPLTVRCAEREKRYLLTISLSPETV